MLEYPIARAFIDARITRIAGDGRSDNRWVAAHRRYGPDRREWLRLPCRSQERHGLEGGENIYCAEVEACLHRHSAMAECCVFGVPDVRLGEEVAAAVVLRSGLSLTAEALRAH
jgi:hypothetical protein